MIVIPMRSAPTLMAVLAVNASVASMAMVRRTALKPAMSDASTDIAAKRQITSVSAILVGPGRTVEPIVAVIIILRVSR